MNRRSMPSKTQIVNFWKAARRTERQAQAARIIIEAASPAEIAAFIELRSPKRPKVKLA